MDQPERLERADEVDAGQRRVQQQNVDGVRLLPAVFEGFLAAGCEKRLEALLFQGGVQQAANHFLRFHDEDAGLALGESGRLSLSGVAALLWAGAPANSGVQVHLHGASLFRPQNQPVPAVVGPPPLFLLTLSGPVTERLKEQMAQEWLVEMDTPH